MAGLEPYLTRQAAGYSMRHRKAIKGQWRTGAYLWMDAIVIAGWCGGKMAHSLSQL